LEDSLANSRDRHLSCSVDESKEGYEKEEDPPAPEDEEEVLVKEVVRENTKDAVLVITPSSNRAGTEVTSYFCWEQTAHWVWLVKIRVGS